MSAKSMAGRRSPRCEKFVARDQDRDGRTTNNRHRGDSQSAQDAEVLRPQHPACRQHHRPRLDVLPSPTDMAADGHGLAHADHVTFGCGGLNGHDRVGPPG